MKPFTLSQSAMMSQKAEQDVSTFYLTNFSILDRSDTQLLCNYKSFIENAIMELGEDWRIESGLLSQQIQATLQKAQPSQTNKFDGDFNIFNEFLWCFLKGKVGKETNFGSHTETQIQEQFIQQLSSLFFSCEKINESLTFKTLSLGFFITAMDQWKGHFRHLNVEKDLVESSFTPFAVLDVKIQKQIAPSQMIDKSSSIGTSTIKQFDNLQLMSCQLSLSQLEEVKHKQKKKKKWTLLASLDLLTVEEMRGIKYTLQQKKNKHSTMVISMWVVNVHEIQLNKKVRVISLDEEFYRTAFIVWILFNIKLFFSLRFSQYLHYFKGFREDWDEAHERPLKKFHLILESEWSKLLKDYSVALHDDVQVLKNLIKRVRKECLSKWEVKIQQIRSKLSVD